VEGNLITIRLADSGDVARIASLCGQLDYPASEREIRLRLDRILKEKDHAVYVAEKRDALVVGWVHVCARRLLIFDGYAEIEALVVDDGCRRRGIGRRLMERAEEWTRARRCKTVNLRSNIVREGAREFYEGIGYSIIKTQSVFRKNL